MESIPTRSDDYQSLHRPRKRFGKIKFSSLVILGFTCLLVIAITSGLLTYFYAFKNSDSIDETTNFENPTSSTTTDSTTSEETSTTTSTESYTTTSTEEFSTSTSTEETSTTTSSKSSTSTGTTTYPPFWTTGKMILKLPVNAILEITGNE